MTQTLPPDDTFTTVGGTTPVLWERVQPWTTMPSHASGGVDYVNTRFTDQTALYSGRFTQSGSGTPTVYGGTPRLAVATSNTEEDSATSAPASDHPQFGAFAFRQASAQDVDVSAHFQVIVGGTQPSAGWYRYFALGARIQGGTLTDSGDKDLERTALNDGYWALRLAQKGGGSILGIKWVLFRVNAGTITRLTEDPVGAVLGGAYDEGRQPFKMQMTVEQDGSGDVEIHVYQHLATSAVGSTRAATEVLSYTDTSGSKITTAGQVGFGMSMELDDTTGSNYRTAHACSWVEATDTSSGTLLFRDEWERDAPDGYCRQTQGQNPGTHPGYSLACGWYGDLAQDSDVYAFPGVRSYSNYLTLSGGYAVATPPATGTSPNPRVLRSSRPATSPFDQHRTCTVRFPSAGNNDTVDPRMAGISMRLGSGHSDPNWCTGARAGYVFWLRYSDQDTSWAAGVYRIRSLGVSPWRFHEVIAFKDGLGSLSLDSDITLELLIRNVDSPNQVSNAPEIKAKVDGVQVTFGPGSDFALGGSGTEEGFSPTAVDTGITILTNGTVYDETSERITSGTGEGLFAFTPNNQGASSRTLEFDDWTEGASAGTGGGDELAEADQASVAVEFDESPGTISPSLILTVPTTWSVTEESLALANVHELDSAHTYTGSRAPYQRRTWTVRSNAATIAERDALIAFWDARDGTAGSFHWLTPDEEDVLVHFVDDALDTILNAPQAASFSFKLEETR